jgi:hypothetical protein
MGFATRSTPPSHEARAPARQVVAQGVQGLIPMAMGTPHPRARVGLVWDAAPGPRPPAGDPRRRGTPPWWPQACVLEPEPAAPASEPTSCRGRSPLLGIQDCPCWRCARGRGQRENAVNAASRRGAYRRACEVNPGTVFLKGLAPAGPYSREAKIAALNPGSELGRGRSLAVRHITFERHRVFDPGGTNKRIVRNGVSGRNIDVVLSRRDAGPGHAHPRLRVCSTLTRGRSPGLRPLGHRPGSSRPCCTPAPPGGPCRARRGVLE